MEENVEKITPDQHEIDLKKDTRWGIPCRTGWEEVVSSTRKMGTNNRTEVQ